MCPWSDERTQGVRVAWILVTSVTTRLLPTDPSKLQVQNITAILGMNKDKFVKRAQKIQRFLFQPFAHVFTGHECRLVKLKTLLQDHLECQAQHFALHAG